MPNEDDQPTQFFIGPDSYRDPNTLLDDARKQVRDDDEKNKESHRLARRLFIALILITVLGVVFYLVLPSFGLRLSPIVPALCFLAILAGAVLTMREEHPQSDDSNDDSVF